MNVLMVGRAVIENHYTFLKGLNPSLQFLVRERTDPNFDPVIQAEYAQGKTVEQSVKGMSEAEVLGESPCLHPAGGIYLRSAAWVYASETTSMILRDTIDKLHHFAGQIVVRLVEWAKNSYNTRARTQKVDRACAWQACLRKCKSLAPWPRTIGTKNCRTSNRR